MSKIIYRGSINSFYQNGDFNRLLKKLEAERVDRSDDETVYHLIKHGVTLRCTAYSSSSLEIRAFGKEADMNEVKEAIYSEMNRTEPDKKSIHPKITS